MASGVKPRKAAVAARDRDNLKPSGFGVEQNQGVISSGPSDLSADGTRNVEDPELVDQLNKLSDLFWRSVRPIRFHGDNLP
jgi:hypothetical protein